MDVRRLLQQQHADLRAMLRMVQGSTAERREIAFDMLRDAVRRHYEVERRHLYPRLERAGLSDLYASIELHRMLCHIVADLGQLDADGEHFFAALEVLSEHVEQHVADEERTILPFVSARFDDVERRTIGREMAETIAEMENEDWLGTPDAWTRPQTM